MTLSMEHLRQRLLPEFPDLEQVADSVIRFIRKAANIPYAVCYVDVSSQLPTTSEALDEYQDRILGRFFFEGSKSLQWSNYVYFVVDAAVSLVARDVIESNRRYARK